MKRLSVLLLTLLACKACLAGAWGVGSFDNDDALDWSQLCIESKGHAVIASTLQAALQPGTIEAPEGAMAIAAAEAIAASKGRPNKALPKELAHWLSRQPRREMAKLVPAARKALVRVKDSQDSELRQLWAESKNRQWIKAIAELDARLQ